MLILLCRCVEYVFYAVYVCMVHGFECVDTQMSKDKTWCLLSPSAVLPLVKFFCLITLSRIPRTALNRSSGSRHSGFVPDLNRKASFDVSGDFV